MAKHYKKDTSGEVLVHIERSLHHEGKHHPDILAQRAVHELFELGDRETLQQLADGIIPPHLLHHAAHRELMQAAAIQWLHYKDPNTRGDGTVTTQVGESRLAAQRAAYAQRTGSVAGDLFAELAALRAQQGQDTDTQGPTDSAPTFGQDPTVVWGKPPAAEDRNTTPAATIQEYVPGGRNLAYDARTAHDVGQVSLSGFVGTPVSYVSSTDTTAVFGYDRGQGVLTFPLTAYLP